MNSPAGFELMGPDGRHGKHADWQKHETPLLSVEATWWSGATVKLPFLGGGMREPLRVEADCLNQARSFSVKITGGNTNEGSADTYEQAALDYARAVEVARLLEGVLHPTCTYVEPGSDDNFQRALVWGMADYMLAAYILYRDPDGPQFSYERGKPALEPKGQMTWPRYDLGQLRARAGEVAIRLRDEAAASAAVQS